MAATQLDWERLPDAFKHALATALPPHAKLVLRAASRALLQLVDGAGGLQLRLPPQDETRPPEEEEARRMAVALQLAGSSVASMDVLERGASHTCLSWAARRVRDGRARHALADAPAGGLRRLRRLRCSSCQLDTVAAAAARPLQLEQLALVLHDGSNALSAPWADEVLPSLRQLQLHTPASEAPDVEGVDLAHVLGCCSQLQSLTMSLRAAVVDEQASVWQPVLAALAPLSHLTRLVGKLHEPLPGAMLAASAPHLRHLQISDRLQLEQEQGQLTESLAWLTGLTDLTHLDLILDLDAPLLTPLSRLVRLQELVLRFWRVHSSMPASALAPLSACCSLTSLHMDCLVLQATHHEQLASLRRLSVGDYGSVEFNSPVSSLAPNLTCLYHYSAAVGDADEDEQMMRLGNADALGGLYQLEVLCVDLVSLDHHAGASSLTALTGLRQLCVEMVGILRSSSHMRDGLPLMPHLTLLAMHTRDAGAVDWADTYDSLDDLSLWVHQSALRALHVIGSARLGGFLVLPDLLELLPVALPQLREVVLSECSDVTNVQLAALVGSRAARRVVVEACGGVSARDCQMLALASGGAVEVDFSSVSSAPGLHLFLASAGTDPSAAV